MYQTKLHKLTFSHASLRLRNGLYQK